MRLKNLLVMDLIKHAAAYAMIVSDCFLKLIIHLNFVFTDEL